MIGYSKENSEIILETAFEQKKMKPGLKLNLGLALIDLRTTGSSCRLEFRAPLVIRNKI